METEEQEQELHQFPDGTIHSFPTGTDPQIIKNEILKVTPQEKPKEVKQSEPISLGTGATAISPPSKFPINALKHLDDETINTLLNSGLSKAGGIARTGAALATSGAAAVATGGESEAVPAFTYSAIDELLRQMTGEKTGALSGTTNPSIGVLESGAENFLGGKLIGKGMSALGGIFSAAKDLISPESTLTDAQKGLMALDPRASQIGPTPSSHPIMKAIEELFNPSGAKAALDKSSELALAQAEERAQKLTGTSIKLYQPEAQATKIVGGLKNQFDATVQQSNARGAATKLIAGANVDANGVKGPISSDATVSAIKSLLQDMKSSTVGSDPDSKAIKYLNNMLEARQTLDPTTKMVVNKPLDFATAWKDKQVMDGIGHNYAPPEINYNDTRFQKVSQAINKDIDTSLPQWQNNGTKAQQLWGEAKQIVNDRHNTFDPILSKVRVDALTSPVDGINNIIDNPKLLAKAKLAGNITIPDASNPQGATYLTNNTNKDLQGYQLMRMTNAATKSDPANPSAKIIDPVKLFSQLDDPNAQESLKSLFGSTNLSNVRQFYKNIAQVAQKTDTGGSRYMGVRAAATGIELGTGLAGALLAGTSLPEKAVIGAGMTSGAVVGFHGLAKLLTSPTTARLMLAAGNGSALGMSQKFAAQLIASQLKGQVVNFTDSDGNMTPMKVNSQGKLEEVKK